MKKCKKICPPEKICNPSSGICVLRTGKVGKEIVKHPQVNVVDTDVDVDFQICNNKICSPEKICNRATDICVLRRGAIGKKIVSSEEEQKQSKERKRHEEEERKRHEEEERKRREEEERKRHEEEERKRREEEERKRREEEERKRREEEERIKREKKQKQNEELKTFVLLIKKNHWNEIEITLDNILDQTTLDITKTKITSIPDTLTNLTILNCSETKLTDIPKTLINLKKLSCYNCPKLTGIPDTLVNLTELYCSRCPKLTRIPDTLSKLITLDCWGCSKLTSIPKTLIRLNKLICKLCPITKIPGTLVNLSYLDCKNCDLLTSIPDTLVNLTKLYCDNCPDLVIPYGIRLGLTVCDGDACERVVVDKNIHPKIGKDQSVGDPNAPYQIPMSKNFVQKTQYRPLPINDEKLRPILQVEPKPHIVWACPVGHLHSADSCGIPTEITVCSNDCPFLVGGVHHFLVPGNYVVYHDGYDVANIWYGEFPVADYQSYELLVEQYNMAAEKINLPIIYPVPERAFNNIATLTNIPIEPNTLCSSCGGQVEVGKTYIFPECGHLICEECLINARGGNLANINVGTVENFKNRTCVTCGKRYRFGAGASKGVIKYKLYSGKSNCTIL